MKTITTKNTTTRNATLSSRLVSLINVARRAALVVLLGSAVVAVLACGGSADDDLLPVVEKSLGLVEGSVSFDGHGKQQRGYMQAQQLKGRYRAVAARRDGHTVTLGRVSDPHLSARQHAGAARQVHAERDQRQNASGEAPRVAADGQDFAPKKVTGTLQKSATLDEGAFTLVEDNECPRWAPCRLCGTSTGRCACIVCHPDDPMGKSGRHQLTGTGIETDLQSGGVSGSGADVVNPGGSLIDPPRD